MTTKNRSRLSKRESRSGLAARYPRKSGKVRGSLLRVLVFLGGILGLLQPARAEGGALESVQKHYILTLWQSDAPGLPHYSFTAAAQDPQGYLWFGSFVNASRFDGKHFTVFDSSTNHKLPGDIARVICVDHQSAVWIGTDNGFARWQEGAWRLFAPTPDWAGQMIDAMAEDREGTLWACAGTNLPEWRGTVSQEPQGLTARGTMDRWAYRGQRR